MDISHTAGSNQLRQYIECVERLEQEKSVLMAEQDTLFTNYRKEFGFN